MYTYLEHRQGLGADGGAEGITHVIGARAPPEEKGAERTHHCVGVYMWCIP